MKPSPLTRPHCEPGYAYVLTKFEAAVDCLAVGAGDVRSRLVDASISLDLIEADDLPPHTRRRYRTLQRRLTKFQSTYSKRGDVEESCRRMNLVTGVRLARIVVEIKDALAAEAGRGT